LRRSESSSVGGTVRMGTTYAWRGSLSARRWRQGSLWLCNFCPSLLVHPALEFLVIIETRLFAKAGFDWRRCIGPLPQFTQPRTCQRSCRRMSILFFLELSGLLSGCSSSLIFRIQLRALFLFLLMRTVAQSKIILHNISHRCGDAARGCR